MTTQTSSSSQRVLHQEAARPSLATVVSAVRIRIVVSLAFAVIALVVAGVPLGSFVPFAGLAACLGMHFFMGHGGHGGDHAGRRHDQQAD